MPTVSWKELEMKKRKTSKTALAASQRFTEGYRCSEAILTSYCGKVGLNKNLAMKIGCAFGGGLGSNGDVCGAITGSIIILGLKHGRTNKDDADTRVKTDIQVQTFLKKFRSKHKHTRCNDLIGFDRSTPKGHDIAAAAGVFKKICPKLVKDAAEILEELLKTSRRKKGPR
jgi:C_GCAxxG_C_C family probable redox protein